MSKKIDSHIIKKYKIGQLVGSGAYGHVWKVEDKLTNRGYALKKVFGAFRNNIDAQRTYRQVQVLQKIQHPNIIKLHKVLGADNKEDLYLIFEQMEADLLAVVGSSILTQKHQKYILFQVLKGIAHLHQLQLIHRDLKPSNVLIDSNCNAKICDFGLVRSLASMEEEHPILSEEVATRWYRAPQLLLGSRTYGYPTDLWSIGCITAQLLTGKPLFEGKSVLEQLQKIIEFTGVVSQEDLQSLDSPVVECLVSQIKPKNKVFSDYFSLINPEVYPLLKGLLKFNPLKRLTAKEALNLSIFNQFSEQLGQKQQYVINAFSPLLDDNKRFHLKDYRKEIYSSIPKQFRSPSDKKQIGGEAIKKKLSVKTLPVKKKILKAVEVVPKKQILPIKKRTHSRPVENRLGQRRFSHGIITKQKNNFRNSSQSPKIKALSPSSNPYLKEIYQIQANKDKSQVNLARFGKKLPAIKRQIKKVKKQNRHHYS